MVLEGDEYLTSPLDRRPKFHLYKPDIGLISGIAWDHINVFPTFENYVEQFRIFADQVSPNGSLVYCEADKEVKKVGEGARPDIRKIPYGLPAHRIENGRTILLDGEKDIPLKVFGDHNLMNINGAREVCQLLRLSSDQFYEAIQSFSGASKRLQEVARSADTVVYKDFAHSPSKLIATTQAVKRQFPKRELVACIELHTYSSLSEKFLDHYQGCLDEADEAIVYFSPHALKLKRLPDLSPERVKAAFGNDAVRVYTDPVSLKSDLMGMNWKNRNLLMMSSGNFDGIVVEELGKILADGS
jgi:UDP-N-acetylmuramate: L-alanyl-gamma-D-glutamyl-meso-diaminopimelate ligase